MRELLHNVTKELEQVGTQGVNTNNLAMLGELVDIYKDLYEAEYYKNQGDGGAMRGRGRDDYYERDSYRESGRGYGGYYPEYEKSYGYPMIECQNTSITSKMAPKDIRKAEIAIATEILKKECTMVQRD